MAALLASLAGADAVGGADTGVKAEPAAGAAAAVVAAVAGAGGALVHPFPACLSRSSTLPLLRTAAGSALCCKLKQTLRVF